MPDARHPISSAPELCKLDAATVMQLYTSGELSPVDVVKATLEHAEEVQVRYNAFSSIDHEGALDAARASEYRWQRGAPLSPIDGVPTTIKDIVRVKDWVVRFGSYITSAQPFAEDAPSVKLLREAGATFIGQTTSPEFAWKPTTDSPLRGVTLNPWDPSKTPGGSSGGAAVAAATGAGIFHLGTDGGGSIRIPSSFTGVVGHKPTFGRVPNFPPSGFFSVSHTGPLTRSVDDAYRMLLAMSGRNLDDWTQSIGDLPPIQLSEVSFRSMKIGFWRQPPVGALNAEIDIAVSSAMETLADQGASIIPFTLPIDDVLDLFDHHWLAGAALRYTSITEDDRSKLDSGFREAAEKGLRLSAVELLAAQVKRAHFGAAMDVALNSVDVVISPATAHLPFATAMNAPPNTGAKSWTEWTGFSYPLNLTGQPACVVSCGFSATGLPIGIQIIGARGADGRVLSIAKEIDSLMGGPVLREQPRSASQRHQAAPAN